MPTYAFRCPTCETRTELFCRMSELDAQHPSCCGAKMVQQLFANTGSVQAEARYRCPATGELVTTRRKRRYLFEKHGLADANDYASNVEKTKKRAQADRELGAQLYKDLPDSVIRECAQMAEAETNRIGSGTA